MGFRVPTESRGDEGPGREVVRRRPRVGSWGLESNLRSRRSCLWVGRNPSSVSLSVLFMTVSLVRSPLTRPLSPLLSLSLSVFVWVSTVNRVSLSLLSPSTISTVELGPPPSVRPLFTGSRRNGTGRGPRSRSAPWCVAPVGGGGRGALGSRTTRVGAPVFARLRTARCRPDWGAWVRQGKGFLELSFEGLGGGTRRARVGGAWIGSPARAPGVTAPVRPLPAGTRCECEWRARPRPRPRRREATEAREGRARGRARGAGVRERAGGSVSAGGAPTGGQESRAREGRGRGSFPGRSRRELGWGGGPGRGPVNSDSEF